MQLRKRNPNIFNTLKW